MSQVASLNTYENNKNNYFSLEYTKCTKDTNKLTTRNFIECITYKKTVYLRKINSFSVDELYVLSILF